MAILTDAMRADRAARRADLDRQPPRIADRTDLDTLPTYEPLSRAGRPMVDMTQGA